MNGAPLTEENLEWFGKLRDWIRMASRADDYAKDGVCPFPLWDQESWKRQFDRWALEDLEVRPACGATFCQAGYVAHVAGGEWIGDSNNLVATPEDHEFFDADPDRVNNWEQVFNPYDGHEDTIHVSHRAQRLLGLDAHEVNFLFLAPTDLETVEWRLDEVLRNHGAPVPERAES